MGNQRTFASMAWQAKGNVTRRERFAASELHHRSIIWFRCSGCGCGTSKTSKTYFEGERKRERECELQDAHDRPTRHRIIPGECLKPETVWRSEVNSNCQATL